MIFIIRSIKRILIVFVLIIIILAIFSIYFGFNGTPWGKQKFEKRAKHYIETVYSTEEVTDIEVEYGFKEGNYYATFYTKTGKRIVVSVGYNNELHSYTLK